MCSLALGKSSNALFDFALKMELHVLFFTGEGMCPHTQPLQNKTKQSKRFMHWEASIIERSSMKAWRRAGLALKTLTEVRQRGWEGVLAFLLHFTGFSSLGLKRVPYKWWRWRTAFSKVQDTATLKKMIWIPQIHNESRGITWNNHHVKRCSWI